MSNHCCVLLLGTNLGERKNNLNIAINRVNSEIGEIKLRSEILETQAEDFVTDCLFLNQILEVSTSLSPVEILKRIKTIEKRMGRVYFPDGGRYQDRIIDIDILKIDGLIYESKELIIPHPQIKNRNFVKKMLGLSE